MTDALIKHMVDRFLGWKLPKNFRPDAGISFSPAANRGTPFEYRHEPTGTNLFDAEQATEMVRYMLDGAPDCAPEPSVGEGDWLLEGANGKYWNGRSTTASGFTEDVNEALRFARYVDAEIVRVWLLKSAEGGYGFLLRAVEHKWCKP